MPMGSNVSKERAKISQVQNNDERQMDFLHNFIIFKM